MQITIEDYRPPSWNRFYSGMHWAKRKVLADEAHLLVLLSVRDQCPDADMFSECVDIEMVTYFKNRPQDTDNLTAKLLIDGLRHAGILSDDTPQQVASVTTRSRVDKEFPRVTIQITPTI